MRPSSVPSRGAWGGALLLAAMGVHCDSSPTGGPRGDASADAGTGDDAPDAAMVDAAPLPGSGGDGGDAEPAASCSAPDAASLDAAAVQAGAAVPQLQACVNCHGTDFSGGGLMTVNGDSQYVANITPDPTTGIGCWTDGEIETAILTAVADDGSQLCLMPAWAKSGYQFFGPLDAGTTSLIVQYLRSVPPVVNAVGDTGQSCAPDAGSAEASAPDAGTD